MNFREAYGHTCSSVGAVARRGDVCALQNLIWTGSPVDVMDNRGWRAIHEAAAAGNPGCLQLLLRQEGVDPDWKTYEEETALLLAARAGEYDCVRLLLREGANPSAQTNEYYTPLWEAAKCNSVVCARRLVRAGANVNHQVYTQETALHIAAEKGHHDMVMFLIEQGAQLKSRTEHELTPVFLAAQFGHDICLELMLKKAQQLDQLDVVNMTASDNASPLLIAAQGGHARCVELLLKYGADPNIPLEDQCSFPLNYAVVSNSSRCLEQLLPVTNLQMSSTDDSAHPLVWAVTHSNTKCLELLIDAGFNIHKKFVIVEDMLSSIIVTLINVAGFNFEMSLLCCNPTVEAANVLLERGLTPDSTDHLECPPLLVSMVNCFSLFRLLIRHGANVNIYCEGLPMNLIWVLMNMEGSLGFLDEYDTLGNNIVKFIPYLLRNNFDCDSCCRFWLHGQPEVTVLVQSRFLANCILCCFCCNLPCAERIAVNGHGESHGDGMDEFIICGHSNWTDAQDKQLNKIIQSTHTLGHACRITIVKQLIARDQYTERAVNSLPVPKLLQGYLMFSDCGEIGQHIMHSFDRMYSAFKADLHVVTQ